MKAPTWCCPTRRLHARRRTWRPWCCKPPATSPVQAMPPPNPRSSAISAPTHIDGGGGVDRLLGDAGNDTYVFHAGQANGDTVVDFAGNDEAVGDALSFVGLGTAAQGATFTQVNATNQWQIHSGLDAHNEFITFSNGATIVCSLSQSG